MSAPSRVEAAERTGDLPAGLIVVEGARNVVGDVPKEELEPASVSYEVKTPYPAWAVIAEIQGKLENAGWKPLPRASTGAIHPSSLRAGWRAHDPPLHGSDDRTRSFVWKAQWRDLAGDVVAYTLMYLKPDNDTLRVNASLSRDCLLPLEALPQALIVLDGAKDVSAWRFKEEQRLGYDLAAPRPPSDVMTTLAGLLGNLGWSSDMEPRPPWRTETEWEKTHKPGWNFGRSAGYAGHLEWRSTWRNAAGASVRYILTYAGALPEGEAKDPEQGVTTYYVEANYRPTGKPNFLFFFPSGRPFIRPE